MSEVRVIINCTGKKKSGSHRAADLYEGNTFKCNLRAARAMVDDDSQIYILSAHYGLVCAVDVIDSYEMTLKDDRASHAMYVARQARDYGLEGTDTYVLAPRAYWEVIWSAASLIYWNPIWANEADTQGVGEQMRTANLISAA